MRAAKSRRGGRCDGAGRKRSRETFHDPKHAAREPLDARHPVHVMLRTCDYVSTLRQRSMYRAIRRVLVHVLATGTLRVTHISIQSNHIHMIVEAESAAKLSAGMQVFAIRAARAINQAQGHGGNVFEFRYQAKHVRNASYARNVIAYVLNNWRRHRQGFANKAAQAARLDPYSSAASSTGWKARSGRPWRVPDWYAPLPVAEPRTALLRTEWQRFGLIDPWETPGRLPLT